jgi:hypothetical protein
VYNPATGAWTAIAPTNTQQADCSGKKSYEIGPLVALPNGKVVSFPGLTTGAGNTAHWTTGGSGWTTGAVMPSWDLNGVPYTMADAPAAVLPNGNILVAMSPSNWAASNSFPAITHFWEYNANNFTFTLVADKPDAFSFNSYTQNFLVLPTGQIIAFNADAPTVEVYTPSAPSAPVAEMQRPVINAPPSTPCLARLGNYGLNGSGFNGLTEGAYYGDDTNASTNFPLIKIVNNSTGHFFFARTYGHSTRSIKPSVATFTNFQVAPNTELGNSTLYEVANGNDSNGIPIIVGCGGTATHDFNGNGKSDVLWRNNDGSVSMWLMNGATVDENKSLGKVSTLWAISGQRDFNGEHQADILWGDNNGNYAMWFMHGTTVFDNVGVAHVPTNWAIVGTPDLNGDGNGDILWRDSGSGALAVWMMNGPVVQQNKGIAAVPFAWGIAATGDFNGDGKGDILWRHTNGDLALWLMNGNVVSQNFSLGNVPSVWAIIGTGDFDGNGSRDIVWRNTSTGAVALWLMDNTGHVLQSKGLGTAASNWSLDLTGDFNGDGNCDIVWTNNTSGARTIWFMNGGTVTSSSNLGTVVTAWKIQSYAAE